MPRKSDFTPEGWARYKTRERARYELNKQNPEWVRAHNEQARVWLNERRARDPLATWMLRAAQTANYQSKKYGHDDLLTQADVRAIYERDNGKCVDCGATDDLTLGHLIPIAFTVEDYRINGPQNTVIQCRSCNSKQHNRIHPSAGKWKLVRME